MVIMEDKPVGEFDEKALKRADYCKSKCTLCVKGREKGQGLAYKMVKLESRLRLCPWCRAYEKVYGVKAYEKPSQA